MPESEPAALLSSSGQCVLHLVEDGEPLGRCPGFATRLVTAGCAHEHLATRACCRTCAESALAQDHVLCWHCWQVGERVPVVVLSVAPALAEVGDPRG